MEKIRNISLFWFDTVQLKRKLENPKKLDGLIKIFKFLQ